MTHLLRFTLLGWMLWTASPALAAASWGKFQKDRCTDSGRRQHSAQLMNVPSNTSWESACQATGATVSGYTFLRPTRCVNKGTAGMWGEFEVVDTTCTPVTECSFPFPRAPSPSPATPAP
ncbi:hypothetical protein [Melittangium boletus]|uniref:hypothetical protein n=1 Tax=Melittangium boletus TaxID=83453 RepID=UPI003DA4DDFE